MRSKKTFFKLIVYSIVTVLYLYIAKDIVLYFIPRFSSMFTHPSRINIELLVVFVMCTIIVCYNYIRYFKEYLKSRRK